MIMYSEMLENGEGVEVNKEESERYKNMATKTTNNFALYSAAIDLIQKSYKLDQAFAMLKQAADNGCVDAMRMYGLYLPNGKTICVHHVKKSFKNENRRPNNQ